MSKILSFDPSGNFHEGKGTTGYAIFNHNSLSEISNISAKEFEKREEYWQEHTLLLEKELPDHVVMEGFRLYNHTGMSAATQANSILETPQLIGAITMKCYELMIPLHIQFAKDVKTRWSDKILVSKKIISKVGQSYYFGTKRLVEHEKDAIRHMMHFIRYGDRS